jgi:hypothetical protein
VAKSNHQPPATSHQPPGRCLFLSTTRQAPGALRAACRGAGRLAFSWRVGSQNCPGRPRRGTVAKSTTNLKSGLCRVLGALRQENARHGARLAPAACLVVDKNKHLPGGWWLVAGGWWLDFATLPLRGRPGQF